jgi:hypothetical protein
MVPMVLLRRRICASITAARAPYPAVSLPQGTPSDAVAHRARRYQGGLIRTAPHMLGECETHDYPGDA